MAVTTSRGTAALAPTLALLMAIMLAGCGGGSPHPSAALPPANRPRIALLPFDNLTTTGGAGDMMTLLFFTEIGSSGPYEPVETGVVSSALESLGIRSVAGLSSEQIQAIGERLAVSRLLVGSVLESGFVHTNDGELPSVGVTLKLLDVSDGRVVWTKMQFKTGEDKETVFGWGRERSAPKLAASLAVEMVREIPAPTPPPAPKGGTP
jgi:TolB-like protein